MHGKMQFETRRDEKSSVSGLEEVEKAECLKSLGWLEEPGPRLIFISERRRGRRAERMRRVEEAMGANRCGGRRESDTEKEAREDTMKKRGKCMNVMKQQWDGETDRKGKKRKSGKNRKKDRGAVWFISHLSH